MDYFFLEILKTLVLAVGTAYLFNRVRLPAMLGYLFAGVLAGPNGFGWIQNLDHIHVLAEWGIFFLMLTIGLEFSGSRIASIKKVSLIGGSIQLLVSILLCLCFAKFIGWDFYRGFFLGSVIALSSTAIVLKFLSEEGHLDTEYGKIALGILIFQDFAVAPLMIISNSIGALGTNMLLNLLLMVLKIAFFIGAIIVFSKTILPSVLRRVAATQNREIFFLFLVILCLATASLGNAIGLSFAIGAFFAGLILANTDFAHQFAGEITPFRHVFVSLFFVSIGLLFNVQFLAANFVTIISVVALIMLVNFVIVTVLVLAFGYPPRIALTTGLILSQIGEFSFLIIDSSYQRGYIEIFFYQTLISATFITMFLTPFLFKLLPLIDKLTQKFKYLGLSPVQPKQQKTPLGQLRHHVILCGFGPTGADLANSFVEVNIPFIVIDFNQAHVESARALGYNVILGDVSNVSVLEHARIKRASTVIISFPDPIGINRIVKLVGQLNPKAIRCVRTRFQSEMARLYDDGADIVVTDEWEANIELNRIVLSHFSVPEEKINALIKMIRLRKEVFVEKAILKRHFK